jgi:ATP-dependent Clp protease ATP-binding subunit ClpC
MTSNIGAWEATENNAMGFELQDTDINRRDAVYEKMKEGLLEVLKDSLSPEFLNRIDEVLIYRKLDTKDAKAITMLFVKDVIARLAAKKINLSVDPQVISYIAETGFDQAYGARNLKRKVQESLENQLADHLMRNRIMGQPGSEIALKAGVEKDQIVFVTKTPAKQHG